MRKCDEVKFDKRTEPKFLHHDSFELYKNMSQKGLNLDEFLWMLVP